RYLASCALIPSSTLGCRCPMVLTVKPETESKYRCPFGPYKKEPSARSISIRRGLPVVCAVFLRNNSLLLIIYKSKDYPRTYRLARGHCRVYIPIIFRLFEKNFVHINYYHLL